ncbi:MAG TPA: hypothetical protein VF349_03985 [Candidatus Limnocylindrales bacterium]
MPDAYSWIAWALAGLAFVLGIQVLGVAGLFAVVVVGLVALTAAGFMVGQRARRRYFRPDPRFLPTPEVFRDPSTGQTMRVHVDEKTGERRYWKAR